MFQFTPISHQTSFFNQTLLLQTGLLATQATASVLASMGQTTVMANVVVGKPSNNDYFPLQVMYEEKLYASGKIKGSRFVKREGRPTEQAILTGRMIDRSIRSLFPDSIRNEIQVIITVLSLDEVNPPDTLSVIAASSALCLCGISCFSGPVSSVRVGAAKDDFGQIMPIANPNYTQTSSSILDLVVSGDGKNIMMVEAGSQEITEENMGLYLDFANQQLGQLTQFQNEFIEKARLGGYVKNTEVLNLASDKKYQNYWLNFEEDLEKVLFIPQGKDAKQGALNSFKEFHNNHTKILLDFVKNNQIKSVEELKEKLHFDQSKVAFVINANIIRSQVELILEISDFDNLSNQLNQNIEYAIKQIVQKNILLNKRRLDGRKVDEVRLIMSQIDVLGRTHGSSLFQRGETQVLNVLTLGTLRDAMLQDDMEDFEETTKRYMHHYNFPSYSVGETGRYAGPGRREIGHGALAEKALIPVLPSQEEFPYTIRLVSECLGSNGSTSMASTCASTLSLLAAGVPIKKMVAGVAMGLVLSPDGSDFQVLTDIQGAEDHYGDMDFKVTGTSDGITAIQLDNKVAGLTTEILKKALIEAKTGRLYILGKMQEVISQPKANISIYAPQVLQINIPFERIGEVIGPSGKMIKRIIAETGVEIDIEDNTGKTTIYSSSVEQIENAKNLILSIIKEYEPGEVVEAEIYRIEPFGAFAKLADTGKEGMIHISKLSPNRVENVEDVVKLGQKVTVTILKVNERGQIDLKLNY